MKRFLIALIFATSSSYAGSIQKWVDENGSVHYGDSPPASIKAQKINVSRPPSNPGKPLPRLGNLNKDKEKENGTASEDPAKPQQTAQASDEEKAKACKTARNNLDIIVRSDNVRLRLPDGSERELSDKEMDERRARYEQEIKRYCQ
jgi:hypothetical protein